MALNAPATTLAALLCASLPLCAQWKEPGVHTRPLRAKEAAPKVDWQARVDALLRQEPGDIVVTAVGDLIFTEKISHLADPEHRQLFRILQEADIAYGNLEYSINDRPELQRPFYNFRVSKEEGWDLARLGINLVSMSNNHALDFGPEGLKECLRNLDLMNIDHAGAGNTLAEAHELAVKPVQGQKTKFGLLSYMRYWTARYRTRNPEGPSLATLNPAVILVDRNGRAEREEGLLESDVQTMEDDLLLARRRVDILMVALHNHDVTHHRAYGIQDRTPPNDALMFRRAVDGGADLVLGSGPHVLRGIELYKGKPIFYSLSDFIYQYRTPHRIPTDLPHQRDLEMPRHANASVWDLRDSPEVMEGVLARMTFNGGRLKRIQLIPVVMDDEGPLYGVPRLVGDARARVTLDRLRRLSEPYGTRIEDHGWYGEILP